MSDAYHTFDASRSLEVPRVRSIDVADLRLALWRGWDDFRAAPTQLLFLCGLYPLIGLVAARAATGDTKPLLFPLLAGLSLMGPAAALGMYEISRQREAGRPTSWLTAFDALRSRAIGGIVLLALVLGLLFAFWVGVAQTLYGATMGPVVPASFGAFLGEVFGTRNGWELIVLGNLAGAAFAMVVLGIAVVAFPMMLDRGCGPGLAVHTSLRAVRRNPGTMVAWGIIVGVILAVGAIPLLIGLAVAMPVLGHATWHLYRRVVV
jgi:uncharacterized membrane protein